MRRRVAPQAELITRVNVTPIIDVALVLVIILLVTAPMLSVADLPVDLPKAHTRETEDQRNVSITRGADGALAVDDQRVSPEALRAVLSRRLERPGNANVLVGGSNSSISLQPLSLQGQTGLNLAVGVAALELRYGP